MQAITPPCRLLLAGPWLSPSCKPVYLCTCTILLCCTAGAGGTDSEGPRGTGPPEAGAQSALGASLGRVQDFLSSIPEDQLALVGPVRTQGKGRGVAQGQGQDRGRSRRGTEAVPWQGRGGSKARGVSVKLIL